MLSPAMERTLIPTVVPPGAGHIDTVSTLAFAYLDLLFKVLQGTLSIMADLWCKTSGKTAVNPGMLSSLPVLAADTSATARARGLVCLTRDYLALWNDTRIPETIAPWAKADPRLDNAWFDGQ